MSESRKKPPIVTEQFRKSVDGVLIGLKTKDGVSIESIDYPHVYERLLERGYGASQIKGVLELGDVKSGTRPNTTWYERGGVRVIVNYKEKAIKTVIRVNSRKGKKGRRKKK